MFLSEPELREACRSMYGTSVRKLQEENAKLHEQLADLDERYLRLQNELAEALDSQVQVVSLADVLAAKQAGKAPAAA